MAIEAIVISQGVPEIGAEVTPETFEKIGTPRVFVPTNNIVVGSGETMQVNGTLVVNGSLIGSGLPQPENPAEALNSLTDVDLGDVQQGQVLKWDGSRWTNQSDESGIAELDLNSLTNVQVDNLFQGQILKWDGSKWINTEEVVTKDRLNQLDDVDIDLANTGDVLKWDGSKWINAQETNNIPRLSQLTDLDLTDLQAGEVLKWSGQRWINSTDLAGITTGGGSGDGASTLGELQDVDLTDVRDMSTLQYDGVSQRWNAVTQDEFVDAVIDAGNADADLYYVEAFDIDGGFA